MDIEYVLQHSSRVLLVDWPSTNLPRRLLEAGFDVFGVSPAGYTEAKLSREAPDNQIKASVYSPEQPDGDYLIFKKLERAPEQVDIVHVFRPAPELSGIIDREVIPLRATTLWLQPPLTSDAASQLCKRCGITFVEGVDIVETIQRIKFHRRIQTGS
jgi:predicted CoA-binding protein